MQRKTDLVCVQSLTHRTLLAVRRCGIDLKLPMADSLILATARHCEAMLWTQDADFERVPGVRYRARAAQKPDQ